MMDVATVPFIVLLEMTLLMKRKPESFRSQLAASSDSAIIAGVLRVHRATVALLTCPSTDISSPEDLLQVN